MNIQIIQDDAQVYHATEALSNSGISRLLECPAKFKYWREHQTEKQTEAMLFGSLFHTMILETDKVLEGYLPLKHPGTTKEGKAERAQAQERGLIGIKADLFDTAAGMYESVMSHPAIGPYFQMEGESLSELSIYWDEQLADWTVPCKARLDHVVLSGNDALVLDIKTAVSSNPAEIPNAIHRGGYHRQQAWYTRALERAGFSLAGFIFVFIEKEPPYLVTPVTIFAETMLSAEKECKRALSSYLRCQLEGHWPDYTNGKIKAEGLPHWAIKKAED